MLVWGCAQQVARAYATHAPEAADVQTSTPVVMVCIAVPLLLMWYWAHTQQTCDPRARYTTSTPMGHTRPLPMSATLNQHAMGVVQALEAKLVTLRAATEEKWLRDEARAESAAAAADAEEADAQELFGEAAAAVAEAAARRTEAHELVGSLAVTTPAGSGQRIRDVARAESAAAAADGEEADAQELFRDAEAAVAEAAARKSEAHELFGSLAGSSPTSVLEADTQDAALPVPAEQDPAQVPTSEAEATSPSAVVSDSAAGAGGVTPQMDTAPQSPGAVVSGSAAVEGVAVPRTEVQSEAESPSLELPQSDVESPQTPEVQGTGTSHNEQGTAAGAADLNIGDIQEGELVAQLEDLTVGAPVAPGPAHSPTQPLTAEEEGVAEPSGAVRSASAAEWGSDRR